MTSKNGIMLPMLASAPQAFSPATGASLALAFTACLAGGFFWARWRQARADIASARARMEAAVKAAWAATRVAAFTGVVLYAIIYVWLHQHHG